jgi:hypothetical protein
MQWTTLGVEHARTIQRFNYVSARCPRVGLASKHENRQQAEASRRLVNAVGVGDLLGPKAERLDLPQVPDARHEARAL